MNTDLLRELWDETPDAIIAVGPDGSVRNWNRAAVKLFGYEADAAIARCMVTVYADGAFLVSEAFRVSEQ